MYPTGNLADTHRGDNTANAAGATTGWDVNKLTTSPGSALVQNTVLSITGPTNGIEVKNSDPIEFISDPLAADVTISGTLTLNVWGFESSMSANTGPQVIIERLDSTLAIVSTIASTEAAVEFGTAAAVTNWTATPTSTNMKRGDRIRVRLLYNDAGGTMGSGFNIHIDYNGPTAAADGDTWIQFNENLTFETSDPAGTQLFLTTTAASGGINPGAATELEAWTSRGSGSTSGITNSVSGWTAPIQITDTAGGTLLEWYTRQLAAFTLGGKAKANLRLSRTSLASNASGRCEIAICASDGSLVSVWGAADIAPLSSDGGQSQYGALLIAEAARTVYVSGADTAVTNGQRLRVRVYIDDCAGTAMSTGGTVTLTYAGTSGGAAGDTWVTLPQSVTEYVPAAAASIVAGISRSKHLIRAGF